jgi:hypothetical protein
MLDETNFYNQKQGKPAELTKKLTYILGNSTREYPLSTMTMGGIGYNKAMKNTVVELDDIQFSYPVIGRMTKPMVLSGNSFSGTPGIGNTKFKVLATDNVAKRFYTIQSPRGVQLYIHDEGRPVGKLWEYTVELDPAGPSDFCPLSELVEGVAWGIINTSVARSESRSTESYMAVPGNFKNQMGIIRGGFSWAGNVTEKVMRITVGMVDVNGKKKETNVWMDYAFWQFENQWLRQIEHSLWYSRYNRQANGIVTLKDALTNKEIPRGSGLLEQIVNKSTYSRLTYDSLSNKIGDALFGQSDTAGMSITLHTGTGGRREFHRAMLAAGATFLSDFANVADKFVTGTGYNLMLGGFFDGFYHIDGYTIKVKHNPVFDSGEVAVAQQASGYTHPESGLPLESYRMVFIDDADYDGQPNIQMVTEKGRHFQHAVKAGMVNMPKTLKILGGFETMNESQAQLVSDEQDKAHYMRLKTCGVQMLRGNRCFDLQCVAGWS